MGFDFVKKTSETIEVKSFNGSFQIWELILELPFDSTRKRMSVIVKRRDIENSEYYVFCKGADIAILDIIEKDNELKKKISGIDFYFLTKIDNLMIFAKEGLRTLCMAKKKISLEELDRIMIEFTKINGSNSKQKNEELMKLYNSIEKDFNFIGASAIEDKLQDVKFI
jgi:magnesium-transporting ATPase (P-type)